MMILRNPQIRAAARWCAAPPLWFQIAGFVLVLIVALAARHSLMTAFPVYGWTHDSWDYVKPAFLWLDQNVWQPDTRRGPVYSTFVALLMASGQTLDGVVWSQHVIGAFTVLALAGLLRAIWGAAGTIPAVMCGAALAVYSVPIHLEHLIRNETLLLLFSTMAIGGLALGLPRAWWPGLALSGFGLGWITVTKSMFHPFGPCAVLAIAVLHRREWKKAALGITVFLFAAAIPLLGVRVQSEVLGINPGGESYAGIQFYGRVGQWTKFDGGVHPEVKEWIKPAVEEYNARFYSKGKLDNNEFIKRLVIEPIIKAKVRARGGSFAEVDKICRDLAFECVREQPWKFAEQVWNAFVRLHWRIGRDTDLPTKDDFTEQVEDLREMKDDSPHLRKTETIARLEAAQQTGALDRYKTINAWAWLFEWFWPPVTMVSFLIVAWLVLGPRPGREFWFCLAVLWFFNMVLYSSVGKPLHRYVIPVLPVMFLTLSTLWCWAWVEALRHLTREDRASAQGGNLQPSQAVQ